MRKMVVLAEDDVDDQDMVREIIEEISPDLNLKIFEDGERLIATMSMLSASQRPSLIILDQNMPRLRGSDTISILKTMDGFEEIPTVIYTTYHDYKFAQDCKKMNVELFQKPDTFVEFRKMIGDLVDRFVSEVSRKS